MAIPFTVIELDKPYRLKFGMGAMIEYEQLTGEKLTAMVYYDGPISVQQAANALLAMLRQENPGLSLRDVLNLVDEHAESMAYVLGKVAEAITAAFGGDDEDEDSPNPETPTA
jgi:hypothetical protein